MMRVLAMVRTYYDMIFGILGTSGIDRRIGHAKNILQYASRKLGVYGYGMEYISYGSLEALKCD